MAKQNRKLSFDRDWNEFNTFSKLIYPYLEKELKYPPRESKHFDEQTWVRKLGDKKGPYDGAFKDENGGVLVLIEAKREGKDLSKQDIQQAFDYCFGDTFVVPPPYVLVSNGNDHKWFKRYRNEEDNYTYSPIDAVNWQKAKKEFGAGELIEQLTLKRLIKVLSMTRSMLFNDLASIYFPSSYKLKESNLGEKKEGFEKILSTRKTFVDSSLADLEEQKAVRHVLSSIALSLTLKVLFIKILTERKGEIFSADVRKAITKWSTKFPGILKAEPYDVLEFSDEAQEKLSNMFVPIGALNALVFQASDNPIGDIWDGLVESEFDDLQVESLGNVYTPKPIVDAMVDASERAIGSWVDKKILEPACGSGHFVREVYKRVRDSYLNERKTVKGNPVIAHKKALDHIRAIDIDPFAVQTTQLGMFLELYRSTDVWRAVAPNDNFDFSSVVDRADFLDSGLFAKFRSFQPDLVIGNPPYGVKVTDETSQRFALGNDDSYGCFIARSLDVLAQEGTLQFVVSNTFMTTKTHQPLRAKIFSDSQIESILQLHRSAFAGRDVFCCIVVLKKVKKTKEENEPYFYRYCDAWPIKPSDPDFLVALDVWNKKTNAVLPGEKYFEYETNAVLAKHRFNAPHAKDLENFLDRKSFVGQRDLLKKQKRPLPIHGGSSSLFLLVTDEATPAHSADKSFMFPNLGEIEGVSIRRENGAIVNTIKLWQIARVFQGLCTSDDETFLRKTPGVVPNARRRYIKDVDVDLCVTNSALKKLTDNDKVNGINVLDKKKTKHFVPFDKGGEQDVDVGELRSYWSPVDYWIDWSQDAVTELKRRNSLPVGTPRKPRYQNSQFYFASGIRFSPAGLYAPMFEISHGGVPGHKGSIILPCDESLTYFLLPVLCSPVSRYLTKNFLQHTVMTEIDIVKQIPIPVPSKKQFVEMSNICIEVIDKKKQNMSATIEIEKANDLVLELYGFDKNDEDELSLWLKRRYPNLGRVKVEAKGESPSPTKKAAKPASPKAK